MIWTSVMKEFNCTIFFEYYMLLMRVKNQKITFNNTDGAIEKMLVLHPVK